MTRTLKAAVYGACHADALETVLHAHPDLHEAVEFHPARALHDRHRAADGGIRAGAARARRPDLPAGLLRVARGPLRLGGAAGADGRGRDADQLPLLPFRALHAVHHGARPAPAADRPDPLGDIDYPALPFVRSAFGLAFEDAPLVRLNGQTVGLARYVAQQRPYWEGVAPSTLRAIFEDTLPPRRWYGALLEML